MHTSSQNTLSAAVEDLDHALSAMLSCGTREWAERMDEALWRVEQAARQQYDPLEPLETVDPSIGGQVPSPGADRRVSRLHHDLSRLLAEASRLRGCLRLARDGSLDDDPNPGDLDSFRDRAAALRDALGRYEHAEAWLVLESATTDIGAGD